MLTYAIGDIHGSYTKLANLIRHCRNHCDGRAARLVLLGDYIDRGKRSRDVVSLLIEIQAAGREELVCLKGNHEDMLLAAAETGDEMVWLANGGDATLRSYGVGRAGDLPPAHLAWMERLPLTHTDERRFFVHAGIMPGFPLTQQRKEVMLWIREPFLSDASDHGLYIVHGHTPTDTGAPQVCENRLNLDTMAWCGQPLFAAVFEERRVGPTTFIADDGTIAGAPAINAREREMYAAPRARAR
ncbi:MAG: serine/threonine protein phosphatase [Hyphomicrobiales bacterium]|nr:serine/threonine protein phosphatase [Hyphomicrobiales bacterium]